MGKGAEAQQHPYPVNYTDNNQITSFTISTYATFIFAIIFGLHFRDGNP